MENLLLKKKTFLYFYEYIFFKRIEMKFLKLFNSSKSSWFKLAPNNCSISTLPKATEFAIDPIIDDELKKSKNKSYGMTSFKKHFGRNTLYDIKFPKDLEKSIKTVLSGNHFQ